MNIKHLTAGIAVVSLATVVWAATSTNQPGSQCVAASSGSLQVRSDGETENASASTVTAVCPVDRAIAPSLVTKVSGSIFVVDRSDTSNVCCKLISKNVGGTIVQSSSVCSTGNSASYQTLAIPQITDTYSFGSFSVQCTVPPVNAGAASRIQLYRTVQE